MTSLEDFLMALAEGAVFILLTIAIIFAFMLFTV